MTKRLSLLTSVFMLVASSLAVCGNITLSPATMSLKGPAGHATTQNFRVLNLTDSVYEFSVDISDVLVQDGKRVFVPADQSALSLASLAITSSPTFELKAGEQKIIPVTFVLPAHTSIRAVAVFFHGMPVQSVSPVKIRLNLGAVVDFSTSDAVDLRLLVPEVSPQTPSANVVITEQLENLGPEPAIVRGIAVILDMTGKLVGKAVFDQKRLLPGESNVLRAEYSGTLLPGSYRVLCSLEYAGRTVTRVAEVNVL